MLVSDLVFLLI